MFVAILRVLCVLAVRPYEPPRRKEREGKLKETLYSRHSEPILAISGSKDDARFGGTGKSDYSA